MKIGILGSGMVGMAIGTKLVKNGHEVIMGSRTPNNQKAAEWVRANGSNAKQGTFADAAIEGEILFNCTKGEHSVESLNQAGSGNIRGKILVDVANPLDFSKGMPPTLTVCNTDSLGEQIQKAFPDTHVVKGLNTVNCNLMADPSLVPGEHDLFICGNSTDAKNKFSEFLTREFGWKNIIDLGDISNSRATEMMLPVWIRLMMKFGTPNFNFHIVK